METRGGGETEKRRTGEPEKGGLSGFSPWVFSGMMLPCVSKGRAARGEESLGT